MKKIGLVVPSYNESECIPYLIKQVKTIFDALPYAVTIIIVDDGSTDETEATISRMECENIRLKYIKLSRNFGKENAIVAGLSNCEDMDAVILMDADLQHPINIIPEMLKKFEEGAEVVDGIKESRGEESKIHTLCSKIFYKTMSKITKLDWEGASDYKILSQRAVQTIINMPEKNLFFRGMSSWIGFKRDVVKYKVQRRVAGKKSWSQSQLTGLALKAITAYTVVPLRMVTGLGIIFLILSFILAIQTLLSYISGTAVTGFTTVILILLIASSCIMISLGVIAIKLSVGKKQ